MENWAGVVHLTNRVLEASPLLPFASLWLRRLSIPVKYNLLFYYIGSEVIFYILNIISRFVFRNDVYVFHLSTAVVVVLLIETYKRLFHSIKIAKFLSVIMVIFLCIAVIDAVFLNGLFKNVNSYSQACGSIILIALALLHIIQLGRTSLSLEKQPGFFLSAAVLLYFSYTIVTYVATNIIYNSGYDAATRIKLDRIISGPDSLLFAIHMGLLAWMFSFFPLTVNPRRALPHWLHYSRWHPRPYKVLGQVALGFRPSPATQK